MHDRHEHDLGLAHDLKVLSRRRVFQFAGIAGASAVVAACAGSTTKQTPTATSTTGATTVAVPARRPHPPRPQAPIPVTGPTGRMS